ncbi:MAG TPA: hypothetical protein VFI05_08180 [Nitrospiraceae bacterium]|nr:hypothetical protein [Nitrospiraceae bacterium]
MADKQRDGWDKAAIILQSLGGFVTAAVVAMLGIVGSGYLNEKQKIDTNVRLYTELMSKREEAESALRKDMFTSIIDTFLKPQAPSLDVRVLNLELLAYNFHESLNLKPLFANIDQQIHQSTDSRKNEFRERLNRVAREITRKQMVILEGAGSKFERKFRLANIPTSKKGLPVELDEAVLTLEDIEREFRVYVMEVNPDTQELHLRLEVITPEQPASTFATNSVDFWVGFYDFPMIDHTRLSHDQRVAITLSNFEDGYANITMAYFPGAYAGLKEKPYYQEVVKELLKTTESQDRKKNN